MAAQQQSNLNPCADGACFNALAPFLISTLVSSLLLGIIFSQLSTLLVLFPERKFLFIKLVATFVVALQVAQTALDASRIVKIFALHYGDIAFYVAPRVEDAAAPFTGVLIEVITQLFLFSKAWRFSSLERKVHKAVKCAVVALLVILSLAAGAAGCIATLQIKMLGSLTKLNPDATEARLFNISVLVWLTTSAAVDLALACILLHELLSGGRTIAGDIHSYQAKRMIQRLKLLVIRGGLLLTAVQLVTAVWWIIQSHTNLLQHLRNSSWVYLGMGVLPKLYTITFFEWTSYARSTPPAFDMLIDLFTARTGDSTLGLNGNRRASMYRAGEKSAGELSVTSEELRRIAWCAAPPSPALMRHSGGGNGQGLVRKQPRFKPSLSDLGKPTLDTISERTTPPSTQRNTMHTSGRGSDATVIAQEIGMQRQSHVEPELLSPASSSLSAEQIAQQEAFLGDIYSQLESYRFGGNGMSKRLTMTSFISMESGPSDPSSSQKSHRSNSGSSTTSAGHELAYMMDEHADQQGSPSSATTVVEELSVENESPELKNSSATVRTFGADNRESLYAALHLSLVGPLPFKTPAHRTK